MSFSVYSDIAWDGETVYAYVSGYDGSWGCSHNDYWTDLFLAGPSHSSSTRVQGTGGGITLPFSGDDGTWTVWSSTSFFCSCVQNFIGAGGGGQQTLERRPTSLSEVFRGYVPPLGDQWYNLLVRRQVLDQFGSPLRRSNMGVAEVYSPVTGAATGSCIRAGVVVETGVGASDSDGQFPDNYWLSGANPPAACTPASATQNIFVSGQPVGTYTVTWSRNGVSVQ
jgi:hypothetical protein